MKPHGFVRAECANYESNGSCLGAHIGDKGQITHSSPKPRCVVSAGARCPYFEQCVVPMQNMVTDPRRAAEIQAAVREYRKQTGQGEEIPRGCPDCGGAVMWRKRYCPACADKRRKATYREHKHGTRQNGVGLSTVKPRTAPESLRNSRGFGPGPRKPYEDSHRPQNGPLTVDTPAPQMAVAGRGAEA